MKKEIKNNMKQRLHFKQFEKQRLVLKALTQNLRITTKTRWKLQTMFLQIPQKSSITRIKNKCIITGRSRSIYKFFKLSRLQLRKYALNGLLPGVIKRNW